MAKNKRKERKIRSSIRFTTYNGKVSSFRCKAIAIDAMECAARLIIKVEQAIGEENAKALLKELTAHIKRFPQKEANA